MKIDVNDAKARLHRLMDAAGWAEHARTVGSGATPPAIGQAALGL